MHVSGASSRSVGFVADRFEDFFRRAAIFLRQLIGGISGLEPLEHLAGRNPRHLRNKIETMVARPGGLGKGQLTGPRTTGAMTADRIEAFVREAGALGPAQFLHG